MEKKNCKLILDCISCSYDQMTEIPECLKTGFINQFNCQNSESTEICEKESFLLPVILFILIILFLFLFFNFTMKNYRKHVIKSSNIMQI